MKRVYFATSDSETGNAGSASSEQSRGERPRVGVFVEMAGGHAAAIFDKKQVGESVKRSELLRGFERTLPDGSNLRVRAFVIDAAPAPVPAPEPVPETAPKTKLEILRAIEAGTAGKPGVASASEPAPELPMFASSFEPYRVRAWLDGRELRETVGQAGREDGRIALALLLLVGIVETIIGVRILTFPLGGATRFLFTGPVFLLGALGVRQKWKWSVSLALMVAIADTIIFVAKAAQDNNMSSFLLTVVARLALIVTVSRFRKSGW
jgi:hypothetical protein